LKLKKIWETNIGSQIFDVKVGDFDGDGSSEIVVCTEDGRIVIVSIDGEIVHELFISENKPIWRLELYDITRDGKMEIISGGMDGLLNIFRWNNDTIELFWSQSFQNSVSGLFFDDINDDSKTELVAYSLDKSLRVLNPLNGELMWGQLFEDGVGVVKAYDCDGDGDIEVIGGGNDGTLRVFNGKDGELKWFKKFTNNIRCLSCFQDKKIVICGGDDKEIYFLNGINGGFIKSIAMDEFVWEIVLYTIESKRENVLVYSYSFDYLNNDADIRDLKFKSKLISFNSDLEINWEIEGFNIEDLKISFPYIIAGTTKGNMLFINESTGNIIDRDNCGSTINNVEIRSQNVYCVTKKGKVICFNLNRD